MLVRFVRIVLMVGNKVVVAGGGGGGCIGQNPGDDATGQQKKKKKQNNEKKRDEQKGRMFAKCGSHPVFFNILIVSILRARRLTSAMHPLLRSRFSTLVPGGRVVWGRMRFDAAVVWCDDSASVTPGEVLFFGGGSSSAL